MDISSIRGWVKPEVPSVDGVRNRQSDTPEVSEPEASKAAQKPAPESSVVSRAEVEDAVSSIQEFVQSVRRDINFSLDDGDGRVVVKVTDADSGDVIRQIPSEEALRLAENLSEVRSLLFTAEA